jgi:hypothetical protein
LYFSIHERAADTRTDNVYSALFRQTCVFLVSFAIVVSRRPDAILNPQFWAEDGVLWYANAYQNGVHAIFTPVAGYLNLLPRLVALISLAIPMSYAPLLFNAAGIVVQVLPVNLFLSSRFSFAGKLWQRAIASFIYLALPNTSELNANLTNAQWHLALLGCMILIVRPADSKGWLIFDWLVVGLLVLTGPFCILLLPIAAFMFWRTKRNSKLLYALAFTLGSVIQSIELLIAHRGASFLGANWIQFTRIVGHQVFLAPIFGRTGLWRPDPQPHWYLVFLLGWVVLGFLFFVYALWHGPIELKLFVVFGILILAASLKSPLGNLPNAPQWQFLHLPGAAGRYWFFPEVAFLGAILWMVWSTKQPRLLRALAASLLVCMSIGIYNDWCYPRFVNLHFDVYARQFEALPPGTPFTIPVNPSWSMRLTKK